MEGDKQLHPGSTTDDVIAILARAVMGHASEEYHRIYVEALRSLVRLAKQEKLYEIKRDTALALGLKRG